MSNAERLDVFHLTNTQPHQIGLLLYAPWRQLLVRVWPNVIIGSTDVSAREWAWLRSMPEPAMMASSSEWQTAHKGVFLAAEPDLNKLLAGDAVATRYWRLYRSTRDTDPLVLGGDWLLERASHVALCQRDGDCRGDRHYWMAIESADDALLIWHINLANFSMVPPHPLRLQD